MSAAIACLRDARTRTIAALEEARSAAVGLDAELSAKRTSVTSMEAKLVEIEAALTALGGQVEG